MRNFAAGTISGGTLGKTGTAWNLGTGQGARFDQTVPKPLAVMSGTDPLPNPETAEIVKCTAISGDSITVERLYEKGLTGPSYVARNVAVGDVVKEVFSAGRMLELLRGLQEKSITLTSGSPEVLELDPSEADKFNLTIERNVKIKLVNSQPYAVEALIRFELRGAFTVTWEGVTWITNEPPYEGITGFQGWAAITAEASKGEVVGYAPLKVPIRRFAKTFAFRGVVENVTYPGWEHESAAGQTVKLIRLRGRLEAGKAKFTLRRNGTTVKAITITAGTPVEEAITPAVELKTGDYLDLVASENAGGEGPSVTAVIESN
jgi:hypothetical protein